MIALGSSPLSMSSPLSSPAGFVVRTRRSADALPPIHALTRAVALALGLGLSAGPVAAMSFGAARLNSALGQPLDLRIPVQSADPNDLDGACLRLLPAPDSDIPTLSIGRVGFERDGLIGAIRIQSLEPVNEPALRVIVEAGCQRRMQREYVLLIDPPALRPAAPTSAATDRPPPPALELGEADIRAVRGRPLLIRVPVRGADAPKLAADCVRTLGDAGSPPALENARARLVNVGSAAPVLEITTREVLVDRTVRVVTELGCEQRIRREFDLLVESPPLASEPDVAPAPAVAAPVEAAKKPRRPPAPAPAKPRPPAAPVVPTAPPAATASPPPAAAAPVPAPAAAPAVQPAPPPVAKDRLVLTPPEETPVATPAASAPAPTQTDDLVRKLDELATEVKRLRTELDAANQRNAVLTEKLARGDSVNLGWAAAAVVSLLFAGLLWMSSRRNRAVAPSRGPEMDAEGPMTRIVGKRSQAHRPTEPMGPVPAQAAPTIAGAVGGTLMTGPLSDVRSQGDIQVTEMGDEEAIRELYADFVNRPNTIPGVGRPEAPGRRPHRADETSRFDHGTRFGDDVPATRMTVPLTTQLAVDIDLTPDETTQGAATQGATTQGAPTTPTGTRPLELDLKLDLPPKPPAPPAERKDG